MRWSIAAALVFSAVPASAQDLVLEEFDTLRYAFEGDADPCLEYIWCHRPWGNLSGQQRTEGVAELTSEDAKNGPNALKVTLTGGNWVQSQTQFYPQDGTWNHAHEYVQGTWKTDHYNRVRLWIKTSPEMAAWGGGRGNLNIGTYVRCRDCDAYSQEAGGSHYYHFYDIPPTGQWHQIILDTHPTSSRSGGPCVSGTQECGNREYPTTTGVGWNYFDALTRFYLDMGGSAPNADSFPTSWYIDSIVLYRETRPENIDNVYSPHGVYVPSGNRLYVGWNRDKSNNTGTVDVAYSFTDIYALPNQFDDATPAPGSPVSPPGFGGYNHMLYDTTAIDVEDNSIIYVAMRPDGDTLFRQIAIPLTNDARADTTAPGAVRNLQVE